MTTAAALHSAPAANPKLAAVPGVPRPETPAHVIRDDAEAIRVATGLAPQIAAGASERDRRRERPLAEIDSFSQSGLWGIINVPRRFGGAEVSYSTLCTGGSL